MYSKNMWAVHRGNGENSGEIRGHIPKGFCHSAVLIQPTGMPSSRAVGNLRFATTTYFLSQHPDIGGNPINQIVFHFLMWALKGRLFRMPYRKELEFPPFVRFSIFSSSFLYSRYHLGGSKHTGPRPGINFRL